MNKRILAIFVIIATGALAAIFIFAQQGKEQAEVATAPAPARTAPQPAVDWQPGPSAASTENQLVTPVTEETTPPQPATVEDRLFSGVFQSDDEFGALLQEATAEGVSEQILLEARILRFWKTDDHAMLESILPEMERSLGSWDFDESEVFRNEKDMLGYYYLFRAIKASDSGNALDFESYVKESFWNQPELSGVLTRYISDWQKSERMASFVMPMDTEILTSQGETTTLAEQLGDNKGIILDFWATWCAPCIALLPELKQKAEVLAPQGIVVAGMNIETPAQADPVRVQREINFPWLVDSGETSFKELLMLDSIPRMVLVSPAGKVLFDGHPMDPGLKDALAKIDVTL